MSNTTQQAKFAQFKEREIALHPYQHLILRNPNGREAKAFHKALEKCWATVVCPACRSNQHLKFALVRDSHTHVCSNHNQDLFFTPTLD